MSGVQQHISRGRAREREVSADRHVFTGVPTLQPPAARQIPLPEFYPIERTSTASFKAPVTSAGKKKLEVVPPPPPGTLTTAMNYISSPVKYISSIFSTAPPPAPEPVKPKERLFKIDMERERDRQISPKVSLSLKKIQTVRVEEVMPASKVLQQPEKSQGSAWRRRNMMDYGMNAPLSPRPASKSRGQSLKRLTPLSSPSLDLSPPKFNQLTIASSMNLNSYKVMSKMPPEEPEKKKKKDVRKATKSRTQKEPPVPTNLNKTHSKNNSVPTEAFANYDSPVYPLPTILPPRVPPPTYTIRSNPTPKTTAQEEEMNAAKEAELSGENDSEVCGSTAISTTMSGPERGEPELVRCPSPTVLKPFRAAGGNESHSVDGEEELQVHETLGKAELGDIARVSRLDQLPQGRVRNATSLKHLFHDAKLVNGSLNNASLDSVLPAGRVGRIDVVLCSSSAKYPSPTRATVNPQSPTRTIVMNRPPSSKDASISPVKQPAAPVFIRSQVKDSQPAAVARAPTNEAILKSQIRPFPHPRNTMKSSQHIEGKTSKEIVIKSLQTKSPSASKRDSHRKVSPLRVEDKHRAVVEDILGKQRDQRRSRQSAWKDGKGQGSTTTSPVNVKPKVNTMTTVKNKDQSPAKAIPSSALSTAAVAAAAATAAAAVTSVLQPAAPDEKKTGPSSSQGDQTTKQDAKAKLRSPPSSWRMDKEKTMAVATASPRTSPKVREEQAAVQPPTETAPTDIETKPKRSLSGEAKDFLKNKLFGTGKEKEPRVSAQQTSNIDAPSEKKAFEENEELNCLENYCGDPAKFFKAATMMGEIP